MLGGGGHSVLQTNFFVLYLFQITVVLISICAIMRSEGHWPSWSTEAGCLAAVSWIYFTAMHTAENLVILELSRTARPEKRDFICFICTALARGYKTFFMLTLVEHEILNAHKYKKYQEIQLFSDSDKPRMLFFLLMHVKMPTIVGILTFMSRKNFMRNRVEHEKSFIPSGPYLFQPITTTFQTHY